MSFQVEKVVKLPTFYAEDTAASANEVWSRLHSDPLFAVSDSSFPVQSMPSSSSIGDTAVMAHVGDPQSLLLACLPP